MAPQKPSVGRIVHYYDGLTAKEPPNAAIVCAINDNGTVDLYVLPPHIWKDEHDRAHYEENVPYSETPKIGCWTWPPRV